MIDSHPPRALDCGLSTRPGVYRKENNTLELEVVLKIVCAGDWIAVVREKRLKAATRQSVSYCDGGAESGGRSGKQNRSQRYRKFYTQKHYVPRKY